MLDIRTMNFVNIEHIYIYSLKKKKKKKKKKKTLWKHAYSNILKILPPKNENFQIKISDISHISFQNIDRGYSLEPPRRGDSNEYPQSMILSRKKEK